MQRLKEALGREKQPRKTKVFVTGQGPDIKTWFPSMFKSRLQMRSESLEVPPQNFYQQGQHTARKAKRGSQLKFHSCLCRECCQCQIAKAIPSSLSTSPSQSRITSTSSQLCGLPGHQFTHIGTRAWTMISSTMTSSLLQKVTPGKTFKKALYSRLNQRDGNIGKWKQHVESEVRIKTASQDSLVFIDLNDTPGLSPIIQVSSNSPELKHAWPLPPAQPSKKNAPTRVAIGAGAEDLPCSYLSSKHHSKSALTNEIQDALQSSIDSPSAAYSSVSFPTSQSHDPPVTDRPLQMIELRDTVPDVDISVLEAPLSKIPASRLDLGSAPQSLFFPSSGLTLESSSSNNSPPASLLIEPVVPSTESTDFHLSISASLMDSDYLSTLGTVGNLSLGNFQPTNDSSTTNLSYFTRDRKALLLGGCKQPLPLSPKSSENSRHESLTTIDPMAVIECAVLDKENRQECTTCVPGKENWCNASRSIFGSTPPAFIEVMVTHLGQETGEKGSQGGGIGRVEEGKGRVITGEEKCKKAKDMPE